jgi:hypothetical protein
MATEINVLQHHLNISCILNPTPPHCKLCNNDHPNPWHTEDNCPFKDPTHILCKITRENVMQHNSVYGAINKSFTKLQDKISPTQRLPLTPTIICQRTNPTARFAMNTPVPNPNCEYNPITEDSTINAKEHTPQNESPSSYIPFETIDEFFDPENDPKDHSNDIMVTPTANVCTGFTTVPPSIEENTAFHDLIVDPSQYLSYNA